MSQLFDLSQFPDLPPEVVQAVSALQLELSVERAARQHEQAVVAEKDAFITELKALIEKLEGQVGQYRHAKFGPKSEKLDPAQLELALEDLETAIAETQARIAAVEEKIATSATDPEQAVLRDDRGWNGPAPPGVVFHYYPGRKGEYADKILSGFSGTIQIDAYGGYTHLAKPDRKGGDPLKLAFCWAHGRRKLIKATPKKGSPIVGEALVRIAALYKIEDAIRGSDPDRRCAVRQELSRPLVDQFFAWLAAQAARVSRKSDLGVAMAYMLRREDGFRLFLDDGRVDIDSNLVENAIRSPAMNRRNALFAGHDEGGRNWARFASLIGSCKMNGVEPYAYLQDLFTKLSNGHLDKDIDQLMPWACAQRPIDLE